MYHLSQEI